MIFDEDKQSPYDTLVELVTFAEKADTVINELHKNQQVFVEHFNIMKTRVDQLEMRLTAWEAVVSSLAEDHDVSE